KKRFGQHWLVNKKILEKIKEIAVLNENDFILEIGPGKGALTSKLLDSEINKLHAIELDKDLINLLNDKFNNNDKFSLQQGDILTVNLDSINKKITKVIANIPYNITGPILDIFIGRLGITRNYNYEKIIFLMQKDIVDRIMSKERSPNAGALSIRMQLLSKIKKICDVPPSSFSPPPKVFSSLVVFEPIKNDLRLDISLEKYIDKLLRISFNSRRKMLRNTLNSILSNEEINELSASSKICFNLRPQDISIDQWIKLAENCIKIKK
ncbi:16S rRNA (adenine(1518)-N(6)/adenine(1519)-N(6))-dimethyltransferase RsmA, partial [uncultured Prochlorococcus sp.]|uniref:16S rRNA (adenine(1518)-N(6)/adenine(1519)-N(6))- dimethyltransferase RsmA n=1 Tax=uncultured Prochlorococcus sp. TaxID=159733 RepID=UPI00258CC8DC